MLRITQERSTVSQSKYHRATIKALGLGKIGASVTKEDRQDIRGMIRKVAHLIHVEEVEVT